MARVLISTHTLYLESDSPEEHNAEMQRILVNKFAKDCARDVQIEGQSFELVGVEFDSYDTETDNIGKCANCGDWTSDRERKDSVYDASPGAVVNGKLKCDICLPLWHPWRFSDGFPYVGGE